MNLNLTTVLERRLKVHPNRATIGIQAQIQDTSPILPAFRKLQKKPEPVSLPFPDEKDCKDVKIGTEHEYIEYKARSLHKISKSVFKYRLKGVLAEDTKDLQQIEEANKHLRIELHNTKRYLLNRM